MLTIESVTFTIGTIDITDLDATAEQLKQLAAAENADAYPRPDDQFQHFPRPELDRILHAGEPLPAGAPGHLTRWAHARAIGHQLNEAGGFDLMFQVAANIRTTSTDKARLIEMWWTDIGDWRA